MQRYGRQEKLRKHSCLHDPVQNRGRRDCCRIDIVTSVLNVEDAVQRETVHVNAKLQ